MDIFYEGNLTTNLNGVHASHLVANIMRAIIIVSHFKRPDNVLFTQWEVSVFSNILN